MIIRITPDASSYIQERSRTLYLDLPPKIGCCIDLQEKPDVKFGIPKISNLYDAHEVDGITVYVPLDFPTLELTITLSRFLTFRYLAVEGWNLI